MTFRTRRTLGETEFFILTWTNASSTAEAAAVLRRNRKEWPYSVTISSISTFASQLRRKGVNLPHMEHRGNVLDVTALNAFLANC